MAAKPTKIEVFALRQHILKMEARLWSSEVLAKLKFEFEGPNTYMGILTVSFGGREVFRIDSRTWRFFPVLADFDQCCQWMMFNRETLDFDYMEFEKGWKPWKI